MNKIKVRLKVDAMGSMTLTPINKRASYRIAKYDDNGNSIVFSQEANESEWADYLPKSAFYGGRFNRNAIFLMGEETFSIMSNAKDERLYPRGPWYGSERPSMNPKD